MASGEMRWYFTCLQVSSHFFLLLATLFHSHDSYKNGNEVSERESHLFLLLATLFHYSHDSYKNGNEVSERVFTCHHSSYLFHYSHDSYENGNEVSW